MLESLKMDLGITGSDKDALLNRLLAKSTKRVCAITKRDEAYVAEKLDECVIDLAIITYNRRGTEGTTSTSVSGMSESYLNDIPEDIKKELYAHRKVGRP